MANHQDSTLSHEVDGFLPSQDLYTFADGVGDPSSSHQMEIRSAPIPTNEVPSHDAASIFASTANLSSATLHQDNELLTFNPRPQTRTLVNITGYIGFATLSAKLVGNFFTAESEDTSVAHLTCYRRNTFGVSGTLRLPSTITHTLDDGGTEVSVVTAEVHISAVDSAESKLVELTHVPLRPAGGETTTKEERSMNIPLSAHADSPSYSSQATCRVVPFEWKRVQFRNSTANSKYRILSTKCDFQLMPRLDGRRKGLQQQFCIRVAYTLITTDGTRLTAAEAESQPIVVRGRNPGNFISEKIPLPYYTSNMRSAQAYTNQQFAGPVPTPMHMYTDNNPTNLMATIGRQPQSMDLNLDPGALHYYSQNIQQLTPPIQFPWTNMASSTNFSHDPGTNPSWSYTNDLSPGNEFSMTGYSDLDRTSRTTTPAHAGMVSHTPRQRASHILPTRLSDIHSPPYQDTNTLGHSPYQPASTTPVTQQSSRDNDETTPSVTRPKTAEQGTKKCAADEPMYEYFPLGLNGWMPPVDAVYRPHVAHNTVLAPEFRGMAVKKGVA